MQRVLSIHVAAIALLGTVLLGMGQEDPIRPLITFVAVVSALYFTDLKRRFSLNRVVANTLAILALLVSSLEFAEASINEKLIAIANLLVYLQVVVWFQEKNTRIYWQLIMLSQVQVVVAAVLNSSILFGILLVVYMFLALVTMSLMHVHREMERCLFGGDEWQGRRDDINGAAPHDLAGRLRLPAELSESALGLRWPLMAAPMRFAGGVSGDVALWLTGRELWRRTARVCALTMVFTVLTFFVIPRTQESAWGTAATSTRHVVGYTETISLGKLGEVSENPELVMQLQFIDQRNRSFQLREPPLLGGSVLTTYRTQRGRHEWSQDDRNAGPGEADEDLAEADSSQRPIRQHITLEPLDEPVVFTVFNPCRLEGEANVVRYRPGQRKCVRKNQDKRMTFDLGTTGIRDGAQYPFTPGPAEGLGRGDLRRLTQLPRENGGVDPLARLKATAAQALVDAKVTAGNRLQAAQALEGFLQNKGGYKYSLAPPPRDPQLDPLEDFVSTHKEGHCEYFAGALALMLRSQGIPSRIVIGFKSDEWNSLGQFYQVRQLHAHAWVEAYLSPADLKDVDIQLDDTSAGAWLRLDPTATATANLGTQVLGLFAKIGQVIDYAEMLWINYVVALSSEQQKKRIYEPLSFAWSIVVSAFTGSYDPQSWQQRLGAQITTTLRWFQGNWFSWRGGLAAACFCLLGFAALWASRRLWKLLRAALGKRSIDGPERRTSTVEFYRRLEHLLGTLGLERQAQQTPREFATMAGGELSETPRLRAASSLPRHIVDAFYRVRFGHETLDNHDVDAVEHALRDLEASLRQPPVAGQ